MTVFWSSPVCSNHPLKTPYHHIVLLSGFKERFSVTSPSTSAASADPEEPPKFGRANGIAN
ncbi:hypothetical protein [Priestia aryabhattai]